MRSVAWYTHSTSERRRVEIETMEDLLAVAQGSSPLPVLVVIEDDGRSFEIAVVYRGESTGVRSAPAVRP